MKSAYTLLILLCFSLAVMPIMANDDEGLQPVDSSSTEDYSGWFTFPYFFITIVLIGIAVLIAILLLRIFLGSD